MKKIFNVLSPTYNDTKKNSPKFQTQNCFLIVKTKKFLKLEPDERKDKSAYRGRS